MLVGTRYSLSSHPRSLDLQLDNTSKPICDSVKNLGVIFDSSLNHDQRCFCHLSTYYFHLCRISQIRKYLTILSRIDYCNSLLSGLPHHTMHTLQHVQNNAACLIPLC